MWTAVKCAYTGWTFSGSQIQPAGTRTVELELERAFRALGCETRIALASRTDAGVSALGNVFVVRGCGERIPAVNRHMSGVICHSSAVVPEGFRVRHATSRWTGMCCLGVGSPMWIRSVRRS